jgi:hypothetical protein
MLAHEHTLRIVVVRLLVVALKLSDGERPQKQTIRWPLLPQYRAWPMLDSDLSSQRGEGRLRFYVCSKAATLSDDEPFPVGTVFVVESREMAGEAEVLLWRFVMEKYAGVTTGRLDCGCYGAWAYMTDGLGGKLVSSSEAPCGIRRLPFQ